jgi:hypothetical protein
VAKDLTGSVHLAYVCLACSLAAAGVLMLTLKKNALHERRL